MGKRILLIDDDAEMHELVRFVLARDGYEVAQAFDAAQGLKLLEDNFDLALLDVRMPGMNGLELLERIRTERPSLRVILMTATTLPANFVAHSMESDINVLAKPFDIDELRRKVEEALNVESGNAG